MIMSGTPLPKALTSHLCLNLRNQLTMLISLATLNICPNKLAGCMFDDRNKTGLTIVGLRNFHSTYIKIQISDSDSDLLES